MECSGQIKHCWHWWHFLSGISSTTAFISAKELCSLILSFYYVWYHILSTVFLIFSGALLQWLMLHSLVQLYGQCCFKAFIHAHMFLKLPSSLLCLYNLSTWKMSFHTPLFNSITIHLRHLVCFVFSFQYSVHIFLWSPKELSDNLSTVQC